MHEQIQNKYCSLLADNMQLVLWKRENLFMKTNLKHCLAPQTMSLSFTYSDTMGQPVDLARAMPLHVLFHVFDTTNLT